jgi:hypothetical protein
MASSSLAIGDFSRDFARDLGAWKSIGFRPSKGDYQATTMRSPSKGY